MEYIKLFENFNSEDDENVEYILTDYYHDDKCEIIKNDHYKLYKFKNLDYYNNACIELDKHGLEYKKALVNNYFGYIIINLGQEVIDFLDDKLLSLKTVEDSSYVYYLNHIDDKKTRTYYNKKTRTFWIDYSKIWSIFGFKFGSNFHDIEVITTWCVLTNLHKECRYTTSSRSVIAKKV